MLTDDVGGRPWELGTDGRAWVLPVGDAHTACSKEVRAPLRRNILACLLGDAGLVANRWACGLPELAAFAGSAGCYKSAADSWGRVGWVVGPQCAKSCSHAA